MKKNENKQKTIKKIKTKNKQIKYKEFVLPWIFKKNGKFLFESKKKNQNTKKNSVRHLWTSIKIFNRFKNEKSLSFFAELFLDHREKLGQEKEI